MRWLDSITNSMDMNLSKLPEIVEDRGAWWATVHGVTKVRWDIVTKQQQVLLLYILTQKSISFKKENVNMIGHLCV